MEANRKTNIKNRLIYFLFDAFKKPKKQWNGMDIRRLA